MSIAISKTVKNLVIHRKDVSQLISVAKYRIASSLNLNPTDLASVKNSTPKLSAPGRV